MMGNVETSESQATHLRICTCIWNNRRCYKSMSTSAVDLLPLFVARLRQSWWCQVESDGYQT